MHIIRDLGNNQGVLSAEIMKITAIPHLSILVDGEPTTENAEKAILYEKLDMQGMLYELYEQYKQRLYQQSLAQNEAIELLWISRPVENQPYRAAADLYIIVRALQPSREQAMAVSNSMMDVCRSVLHRGRYETEEENSHELAGTEAFFSFYQNVDFVSMKAIVKSERVDILQNTILPACYAYDTIPATTADLSRLVSSITDTPYSSVSMQLIPTYFSDQERQEITGKAQALNSITSGVSIQGAGSLKVKAAERAESSYSYYNDNGDQALFLYNIVICSAVRTMTRLSSGLMGQLNARQTRMAGLNVAELPQELHPVNSFLLNPWQVNNYLMKTARPNAIWHNTQYAPAALWRAPFIITSEEASQFFRLPIGSDTIGAGLNVNETGRRSRTYAKGVLNNSELPLGTLKGSAGADEIGLNCMDLAKHMLIVGTPGSGKTTFCVGLLDRLWKKYGIPFLVIEPAKNEYRALVESIPELQVFTPGKPHVSPFVFNPFVPPSGVRLGAYKSVLKTAFAAGVTMSSPLDKIFEDTVNNCYSDFKWLDTYTIADKGVPFNIDDFVRCFNDTFNAIGYTGDVRNMGRAGVVRLQGLVSLFDNYYSIPIEDILKRPTIIELAAIENNEQKALIIALLLLSILSYVNSNFKGGEGEDSLRNFILLEEAHVLLDASSEADKGAANPTAIAQGLVKRMLAEIRSYGIGLGIADQSPRKVGMDIVALTDVKMAFRLVESTDRQILADSTNMTDVQELRLAKLKPGSAFLFYNKLEEPEEIITPNYRHEHKIDISLTDDGIRELSTYWTDKQDRLRPYPQCKMTPYCKVRCDYGKRLLAKDIVRRLFRKINPPAHKTLEELKKAFAHVDKNLRLNVIEQLDGMEPDGQLLQCVRVHLYRKMVYETRLKISDAIMERNIGVTE